LQHNAATTHADANIATNFRNWIPPKVRPCSAVILISRDFHQRQTGV
jgi:hypothetical protein